MSEKFLLIKINECPEDSKELMERASGNWAIREDKLVDVKYMMVLCKNVVKAIYDIKQVNESEEIWVYGNRLSFDLSSTDKFQKYLDKELISFTSNPATILLESDMKFK